MKPKTPHFLLLAGLVLTSCNRETPEKAGNEDSKEVIEALEQARESLEAERQRMQQEREALEAQRAAAATQPEAPAPAALPVEEVQPLPENLDDARNAETRRVLEEWERSLDAREKELAGKQALADAESLRQPEVYRQPVADYGLFYDSLSEHGQWFETSDYGYIFQPQVVYQDRSWRPYTRGRWICTDRGWLWVSDEPFGWACYHYGRWVLISGRGWCWVPGNEWAPSWVAWRQGGGHVGWAPLPPETLAGSGRNWGVNVDVEFGIADSWFCFVEEVHFAQPIHRHCLPVNRNSYLRPRARGITNLYYVQGQAMSCGPSYASLRRHVNNPWPVWPVQVDPIAGIGRPDLRPGGIEGRNWRVFAPNLRSPWNPACRPQRVHGEWDRFEVVRASGGVQADWVQRFEQRRRQQDAEAAEWASRMHRARLDQVENQRREVEAFWERFRRQQAPQTQGQGTGVPVIPGNQGPGGPRPGGRPDGVRPPQPGGQQPGGQQPGGQQPGGQQPGGQQPGGQQPGGQQPGGQQPGGQQPGGQQPGGQQPGGQQPGGQQVMTDEERVRQADELARQDQEARRLAEEQRLAEEARARAAMQEQQRLTDEEAAEAERRRIAEEEATRGQNPPEQGQGGEPAMNEEQARELQEAQQKQQEEMQRQAEEEQARRQQEEQARMQQEETARRQQEEEMARQQEEEARRQQEEAMRRQQEEEMARQQQEEARRQQEEEMRRQQEEEMRRQQEEEMRRQQEEEMRRQQEEEMRRQQEEEMRRQQEEEMRRQQEEEMRRQQEEEMRRQQEEMQRQQEEMQRQQEEARRQAEEMQRQQQEQQQQQQ
ncbi:MAG: hypothetical protein MUF31_09845 [Akkermansiaceae bacterium]|jgi:hypothetical protein|nr:hypothetical protein [Akkermansiaceae bacterium]